MNHTEKVTFWDHLDELRGVLFRIAIGVIIAAAIAFFFKDAIFAVIFAPKSSDFITYGLIDRVSGMLSFGSAEVGEGMESFSVQLINTQLTQQFTTHIQMSIYVGLLLVFPYVLYELFRFVSPALYENEQRYTVRVVSCGYVMFLAGVALSYFLIFPLTLRFLASYQVSSEVQNYIALDSYIGTMMLLNLMMGIVFEIPILCWLFAKLGFLSASFMREYRRHAIVILLFISALITPTSDIVTLLLVAMPMYILYELSIVIVMLTKTKK